MDWFCNQIRNKRMGDDRLNKRQWKKQGTKLQHNKHYAQYLVTFLGVKIDGLSKKLDRKWIR